MKEIFNQVEELTGTYPTGDNLRNAVHAIITQCLSMSSHSIGMRTIVNNMEYIARTYEQNRGTTQALPLYHVDNKTKFNPAFDEYMHPEEAYKPDF